MKENKNDKKDFIILILLLLFSIGSLVNALFFSQELHGTIFLGIATLLLLSQLKKMNIKL